MLNEKAFEQTIERKQRMKKRLITGALLSVLATYACPVMAEGIQMLPPTPLGSMAVCPSGTQQILSYSGTPTGGAQSGINCVPIATDAQGDMAASGFVQVGSTASACDAAHAGAISYNRSTNTFQGCNGSSWQSIGGGGATGKLYWSGAWTGDNYWCDPGYHVVGFHYDCGCSNNATWFECQAN
jgi:hypothetical protein